MGVCDRRTQPGVQGPKRRSTLPSAWMMAPSPVTLLAVNGRGVAASRPSTSAPVALMCTCRTICANGGTRHCKCAHQQLRSSSTGSTLPPHTTAVQLTTHTPRWLRRQRAQPGVGAEIAAAHVSTALDKPRTAVVSSRPRRTVAPTSSDMVPHKLLSDTHEGLSCAQGRGGRCVLHSRTRTPHDCERSHVF